MRRTLSAARHRSFAARCLSSAVARRRAQSAAPRRTPAAVELAVARPHGRSLHRLLPVRLRRLDGGQSDAGRSPALGPIRRAAGAQLRRPARVLEAAAAGRDADDARRSATTTPPAWTRRRSSARGSTPLAADLRNDRGARAAPRRSARRARRISTRSASTRSSGSASQHRLARDATTADRGRRSGRPRPARPRLLPPRRRAIGRDPANSTSSTSARLLDACSAAPRRRAPPTPRRSCALETALAKAALDRVARRDPANIYHQMTLAGAAGADAATSTGARTAGAAGAPAFEALNVASRTSSRPSNALLDATPLDDLKAYLRWQLVHAAAPHAAEGVRRRELRLLQPDAAAASRSSGRGGSAASATTDGDLGEALGKAFVERGVRPAGQGRHADDGRGHQGRDASRTSTGCRG